MFVIQTDEWGRRRTRAGTRREFYHAICHNFCSSLCFFEDSDSIGIFSLIVISWQDKTLKAFMISLFFGRKFIIDLFDLGLGLVDC